MCGSEDCKHFRVYDSRLEEYDPNRIYGKWEGKEIEDFKDKIMDKNMSALLEDGMY